MIEPGQEKGTQLKVEPIRKLKDVHAVKHILSGNPRNLALFTLGINTNLKPSELVQLRVAMVKHLETGEKIEIRDEKSGKERKVYLNRASAAALKSLIAAEDLGDDQVLFLSQRGGALAVNSINRLVKSWCEAVNLTGNFGSHTLRKTWGYHQYHTFNTDISTLMAVFNHTTQKQTAEYLGLNLNPSDNLFDNEL